MWPATNDGGVQLGSLRQINSVVYLKAVSVAPTRLRLYSCSQWRVVASASPSENFFFALSEF